MDETLKRVGKDMRYEVYSIVSEYFATGMLYNALNKSGITLIPKVSNASFIH